MDLSYTCMCKNCQYDEKKRNSKTFYNIQEGDSIKVFSSGQFMGVGIFLRVEDYRIIWMDRSGNLNITDLTLSNIKKLVNKSSKIL